MPLHLSVLCFALLALPAVSLGQSREARQEAAVTSSMKVHTLRLRPGEDLLKSLSAYIDEKKIKAAIVLTAVGSLTETRLRLANRPAATVKPGKVEIVSLVGTLEPAGGHLHLSVSDGDGATFGGHLLEGCTIFTTAEIAIGELPGLRFVRKPDAASGYDELKMER